jgi:hypothetical protein
MVVGFFVELVGNLLHHLQNNNNNNDVAEHEQQQQREEQDATSHDEDDDGDEESEVAAKQEIVKEEEPLPRPRISPEEQHGVFAALPSSLKQRVATLGGSEKQEEEACAKSATKAPALRDSIVPSTTSSLSDVGEQQSASAPAQPPPPLLQPQLVRQHQTTREEAAAAAAAINRSVVAMVKAHNPHKSSLPLSMRLMQHVSGIAYCQDCAVVTPAPHSPTVLATTTTTVSNNNNSRNIGADDDDDDDDDDADTCQLLATADSMDYDIQALQRQQHHSSTDTSPLLRLVQRQPLYPHQSTMERTLFSEFFLCPTTETFDEYITKRRLAALYSPISQHCFSFLFT